MAATVKQREGPGTGEREAEKPESEAIQTARARATDRLQAINGLSGEPDDRYPEYDDDHEYDITDGIADGWLEDEPDRTHPIDDISEAAASAEPNRRCIIRFTYNMPDDLQYHLSTRHSKLQQSMNAGRAGEDVLIREERHARLANILMTDQKKALTAETPRGAYLALKYRTQGEYNSTIAPEQVQYEKKPTSPWLARTSHEMIACQWGTVPQQFFFWAPKPRAAYDKRTVWNELLNIALARFHYLAGDKQKGWARDRLGRLEDQSITKYVDHFFGTAKRKEMTPISEEPFPLLHGEALALARKALAVDEEYRDADDESQKKSDDSIRKLTKLANSIVSDLRFRVEKLRKSCERWNEDELNSALPQIGTGAERPAGVDSALSHAVKGRGMEFFKFSIAGWEPEPDEIWYLPSEQNL